MPHARLKMEDKVKDQGELNLQNLKSIIKSPSTPSTPFFCKKHGFNVRVCRMTNCDCYSNGVKG